MFMIISQLLVLSRVTRLLSRSQHFKTTRGNRPTLCLLYRVKIGLKDSIGIRLKDAVQLFAFFAPLFFSETTKDITMKLSSIVL